MPIIKVRSNKIIDQEQFKKFLFNKQFLSKWPHAKNAILYNFPDLKEQLAQNNNSQDIVDIYVQSLYDHYHNEIEDIKEKIQNKVKQFSKDIFLGLEKSMDFTFSDNDLYFIDISLVPYSTYNDNKAIISVLGLIRKLKEDESIEIFIHEITHVIFDKKMEDNGLLYKLNSTAYQFLKEIVAPIIIRTAYFDEIGLSTSFKIPNPEQNLIFVSRNGIVYPLVDYFDIIYNNHINEGKGFDEYLNVAVNTIRKIQNALQEKQQCFFSAVDGTYVGSKEFQEKLNELGYSVPIII